MFKQKNTQDKLSLVEKIISIADVDTVFRDIYIEHAKDLLADVLPPDVYQDIIREKNSLAKLPNSINEAMEKNDWKAVKELSRKMKDLHRWSEENEYLFNLGRKIYSSNFIYINPFSPGLYHEAGISIDDLPAIRKDIVKKFESIIPDDKSMKDFYQKRKTFFNFIKIGREFLDESKDNEVDLEEQARFALEHGDISRLEELSEKIMELKNRGSLSKSKNTASGSSEITSEDKNRFYDFNEKTLKKAENLGLKPYRAGESPEYASLIRHALTREFKSDSKGAWEKIIETDPLFKDGVPELLKTRTEVLSKHLIINSLGSRHFPDYVAEDILVEDFHERQGGNETVTPLLEMLGFNRRRSLSRLDIEHSLFINGYRIVRDELGLDPVLFKLVCIPSDIYLRLGDTLGWGKHEIWTHFDGYGVMQHSRFNAMAGGDKRFGGIYDLVTIGREYESDHVLARFAVVQRERMLRLI